ncbi:hypothetical protein AKJ16_DCAP01998 [Drosera capensis]
MLHQPRRRRMRILGSEDHGFLSPPTSLASASPFQEEDRRLRVTDLLTRVLWWLAMPDPRRQRPTVVSSVVDFSNQTHQQGCKQI